MTVLIFQWDGEAMAPLKRFHNLANDEFTVGQLYTMDVVEQASTKSRNHYFASINEAWLNLPDHLTAQFQTSEHLRKFALIKAGFADQRSIVCASKAEALRMAAFIKPMDEYAVVAVSEAVVTVYTAKSQSKKAMGKDAFGQSKDAVLSYVSDLIGVTPAVLAENRSAAA